MIYRGEHNRSAHSLGRDPAPTCQMFTLSWIIGFISSSFKLHCSLLLWRGWWKRSVAGLGWCRDGTNDTLIRHEHCRPRPTLYSPARPSPSQQPATLFFYQDPCPQCPQSGLASGHWRSCRIFLGFQGHVLFWGESMAENKRAIAMSTHISLSDLFIPRRSACGWGHIQKTWYDERGKQTKYLLQYNLFKACKNIGGKICIS